jgi:sn-glycerol 3-phosphate transport system permease protein
MAAEIHGMVEKRGPPLADACAADPRRADDLLPDLARLRRLDRHQPEIVRPPMPLLPGDQFFENYRSALVSGVNAPVATMLFNSLVMAIGIAIGKIIISLLSAFAIVYFRFPFRMSSSG